LTTPEPLQKPAGRRTRIDVRNVLGTAWPLFQVCLPTCLPLAVVAVAASATPSSEAVVNGEAHGYLHSREWWGVLVASTVLTLVCYGAMLRQQLGLAAGDRPQVLQSLRLAARDVPFVLVLLAISTLPFVPAMVATALRGFDTVALLLTAGAMGLLVYALPAWPALIAGSANPWTALTGGIALVRGRWLEFAGVVAALLAGVLVFALLASILISMVMNLAGQGINPTSGGLAFSRWLIALVLAVPMVYAGAVSVVTWLAAARNA
jgi:hypothetical protein